jgi:hypothetical protein
MKTYEKLEYVIPDDVETLESTLESFTEDEVISISEQHPSGYDYDEECDVYTLFNDEGEAIIQFRSNDENSRPTPTYH